MRRPNELLITTINIAGEQDPDSCAWSNAATIAQVEEDMHVQPPAATGEKSSTETIGKLCEYIRQNCQSGGSMLLPDLSRQAGLSPFHLQRLFTKVVGVSPRKFVQACRIEALKANLRDGSNVTDAIYESGFGSSSRVYERVDTELGMTPTSYRAGGKGMEISYVVVATPVGRMLIAATDRGLCSVQLGETREELVAKLEEEFGAAKREELSEPYSELFQSSIAAMNGFLERQTTLPDLPLDVRATAFQLKVWKYLQAIPAGEVRTYAQVASGIGQPQAVRAVASACARNRVALVIPCHRVIRSDGQLGGYRWGAGRKQMLLDRERAGTVSGKRVG